MDFKMGWGVGWGVGGKALSYHDLDDLDNQAGQDSKSDLVDQHDHHNLMICKALVSGKDHQIGRQAKIFFSVLRQSEHNFYKACLTSPDFELICDQNLTS